MKNKIVKSATAVLAAAMLTACGGQSASSPASAAGAQSTGQSSAMQAAEEQTGQTTQQTSEKTWKSTAKDIKFNIDFREYPQTSSGEGYVENLDGIALAIGASDSMTSMVYEGVDVSNFTDPTQVPEALNPCFVELLGRSRWNGDNTTGEMNQTVTVDKVESAGEENGYALCRFEGTYSFNTYTDDKVHSFALVGYTVLLHQSGYPVYVLAADMTDEQSHTGELDKIAHDCISSLRETAQGNDE